MNTSSLREKQHSLDRKKPLEQELVERIGNQTNITFGSMGQKNEVSATKPQGIKVYYGNRPKSSEIEETYDPYIDTTQVSRVPTTLGNAQVDPNSRYN